MTGLTDGAAQFAALSRGLKEAGETGLRKELYKAINDAGKPIAQKITSVEHLKSYLPDRYAAVLAADLACTVSKLTGRDPGITLRARSRARERRVRLFDAGLINHPKWPRGDRAAWKWKNGQTGGMKAGFFTDAVQEAAPEVRSAILQAMADVSRKIVGR